TSLLSFSSSDRPPPGSTLLPCTTLFRSPTTCPSASRCDRRVRRSCVADHCLLMPPSTSGNISSTRWFTWYADVFAAPLASVRARSEEHTSELQSREKLVCRLLLENKRCK